MRLFKRGHVMSNEPNRLATARRKPSIIAPLDNKLIQRLADMAKTARNNRSSHPVKVPDLHQLLHRRD